MRYFTSIRLALAPVNEKNLFKAIPNQLVITVWRYLSRFLYVAAGYWSLIELYRVVNAH